MPKNDFFAIAYKILDYLYSCMKNGIEPEYSLFAWDSEAIQIEKNYWEDIILNLYENGYIKGIKTKNVLNSRRPLLDARNISITMAGIEYLSENSMMAKTKECVKSIFDIVGIILPSI